MRDDELEAGEVTEDRGAQDAEDRDRLLRDEVLAVSLAAAEAASGVDQRWEIVADELFIQRVPVLVAEGRGLPLPLRRVGVNKDAHRTQVADRAVEFFEGRSDWLAGGDRKCGDRSEAVRVQRHGPGDEVVVGLHPPVHNPGRPG